MFINGGDACDCGGEAAEAFNEEEEEDEDETRRGYDFRALMTVTGSVETVEVEVAVVNRLFELALPLLGCCSANVPSSNCRCSRLTW